MTNEQKTKQNKATTIKQLIFSSFSLDLLPFSSDVLGENIVLLLSIVKN